MANYRNGKDTRNIIIRTANKLFWERGYSEVTFDDICRQAHVRRSTISYHFKTKDHILRCCGEAAYEKTIMAASFYCDAPPYLYILARSIYWYYVLHDAEFYKMAVEFARLEMTSQHTNLHRYERLISCFLPALFNAGIEKPEPLPLTEISLRGLDHAPFLLGAVILQDTIEHLMEDYLKMVGQICGLPASITEQTWQEVFIRMQKIPYDTLHLHWF